MNAHTKAQLATILSALAGRECRPANAKAATTAIARYARALGLDLAAVLAAAPGLLDGRLTAEEWLAELQADEAPAPARRRVRDREPEARVREPRETKQARLLELLRSPNGVYTGELMAALGWQRHTVRGAISTLAKKHGLTIEAKWIRNTGPNARGGDTIYRLA